jgi:hypothetical protein
MNNNNNFSNINPNSFDKKIKNNIVNQNIYHSGYGSYKTCPINTSIKFSYKNNCNPGTINEICKVLVHNTHSIDIVDRLSEHGLNKLSSENPIPAIMYPIAKSFLGSYEIKDGIYDDNIFLRSNYSYIIKKQNDLFPIRKNNEVIYSNPITIIRDSNYNPLSNDDIFKLGVITLSPELKEDLISMKIKNGDNTIIKKVLTSKDLLKLQMNIEAVFQVAICGYHNILILNVIPNIPIEDQVLIYNNSIMKYGHKFKAIMMCIPPYEDIQIYNYFNENIIKPQNLVENINMKYKEEIMATRLENKKKKDIKEKMSNMTSEEKIIMLRNIVKKNKKSKFIEK